MNWEYRIVKTFDEEEKSFVYQLREVYFEDSKICFSTAGAITKPHYDDDIVGFAWRYDRHAQGFYKTNFI